MPPMCLVGVVGGRRHLGGDTTHPRPSPQAQKRRIHLDLNLRSRSIRDCLTVLRSFAGVSARSMVGVPAFSRGCPRSLRESSSSRRSVCPRPDRGSSRCRRRRASRPPRAGSPACAAALHAAHPDDRNRDARGDRRDLRERDRADRRTRQAAGARRRARESLPHPPDSGAGVSARSVLISDTASAPASWAACAHGRDVGRVGRQLDDQRLGRPRAHLAQDAPPAPRGRRRCPGRSRRSGRRR